MGARSRSGLGSLAAAAKGLADPCEDLPNEPGAPKDERDHGKGPRHVPIGKECGKLGQEGSGRQVGAVDARIARGSTVGGREGAVPLASEEFDGTVKPKAHDGARKPGLRAARGRTVLDMG